MNCSFPDVLFLLVIALILLKYINKLEENGLACVYAVGIHIFFKCTEVIIYLMVRLSRYM